MKRENRKKEEGKLMGIVNMMIWLFAGFVAVAAAAVVYYLNKNSGKKREGERTSVVIPRSPATGNFPAREDCWKKYKQTSYEKKYTQCCKNVFTETAILFYLEKLFTTAHYELKNQEWEKEKEMICYYINDGLLGALRYRMKDEKGGYGGPSVQSYIPDVDEETYYYQRGMNQENREDPEDIRAEYQRLEEEREAHLKDKNTVFYRMLWNKFQPDLKELLDFGEKVARDTGDSKKLEQEFEELMERVREDMRKLGIAFIYDDEADSSQLKEYFQAGEKEERETAVVRMSDHYIYYLGKTNLQKKEGTDEA